MKKQFFLLLCATILVSPCFSQTVETSKVPTTVKRALTSKHTGAKYIEWQKDGDGYVAYFTVRDDWASAYFTPAGKWKRSEINLNPKSIPSTVKKTLVYKYKGFKASDVVKMQYPKRTIYHIQVDKGTESFKLEIKGNGDVIKETKIEYEEFVPEEKEEIIERAE